MKWDGGQLNIYVSVTLLYRRFSRMHVCVLASSVFVCWRIMEIDGISWKRVNSN